MNILSDYKLSLILKITSAGLQAVTGILIPIMLLAIGGNDLYNSYVIILIISSIGGIIDGAITWKTYNWMHKSVQKNDWAQYSKALTSGLSFTITLTIPVYITVIFILSTNSNYIYKNFSANHSQILYVLLLSLASGNLISLLNQGLVANNRTSYGDFVGLVRFPIIIFCVIIAYISESVTYLIAGLALSNILTLVFLARAHSRIVTGYKFEYSHLLVHQIFDAPTRLSTSISALEILSNSALTFIASRFLNSVDFSSFNIIFKIVDVLLQFSRKGIEAGQHTITTTSAADFSMSRRIQNYLIAICDQFGLILAMVVLIACLCTKYYLPQSLSEHTLYLLYPYFALGLLWNPPAYFSHISALTGGEYHKLFFVYLFNAIVGLSSTVIAVSAYGFVGILFAKFIVYVFLAIPVQCYILIYKNRVSSEILTDHFYRYFKMTIFLATAYYATYSINECIWSLLVLMVLFTISQFTIFKGASIMSLFRTNRVAQ